jgi:hypothetical protein|tara:strand:- start:143 stop:352 length:210 start_codon:yes stop_codon:yes gene_type:complete
MTNDEMQNKLEIIEMKGELKLLHQKIDTIKSNDLVHMEKAINGINKVLWTVGVMVFAQFIWLIKTVLMG